MLKIMQENLEDLTSANLWRSLSAEFLGTLFLVFLGCGSTIDCRNVAADGTYMNIPNVLQIALTFGFIVGTMVWCISHISGGHLNPAISLGALITRRISIIRGLMYMVAQVLGAMVGAGILYGLTPELARGKLGTNILTTGVTAAQGFGVELMITFVLVFTFFACVDEKRDDLRGSAPLTLGLAVAVCHLFAVSFTDCGMNPARSFGPAVVMNIWSGHWIYWIGPMVGGILAALSYEYIFAAGATFHRTKKCILRSKAPAKKTEDVETTKVEIIEIEEMKEPLNEDDEVKDEAKDAQLNGKDQ